MDRRWSALSMALVLLGSCPDAIAYIIFPVGTGLGCGYATIQDAVDAAAAYEGEK